MPAATNVVNLACARCPNEFRKRFDQIEAVNVVADLFSFVAENPVRSSAHSTDHQVREKTMQLSPSVRGLGQTAATKREGRHSAISPVCPIENVPTHFPPPA